jgi:hypothetical protein
MPTIEQNKMQWSGYDGPKDGAEWSGPWAGTAYLWHGTVMPRIAKSVPAGHFVELGPGYGRCTQYLVPLCRTLTIVDLAEKRLDA